MSTKAMLLVEDCQQDEKLTLRALRRVSMADRVTVVHDGQAALDYLFGQGEFAELKAELPAVVLLDIGLPQVSGLEVLEAIRSDPRTAVVPVVMHTASDNEAERLECYREGVNSFIRKSMDLDKFSRTVALIGRYWLSANDAPAAAWSGETLEAGQQPVAAHVMHAPACESGDMVQPNREQLAALADMAGNRWGHNPVLSDSEHSAGHSVEFLARYLINHGNTYSLPAELTKSTWALACRLCASLETFAGAGKHCPFGLADPCRGDAHFLNER